MFKKDHSLLFPLQLEEDKKNSDRLQELIDKLQGKINTMKRQIEEAVSFSPCSCTFMPFAIVFGCSH